MNEIDKWTAEQCGVIPYHDPPEGDYWEVFMTPDGITHRYRWTIKDPRCREIVREHFHLRTYFRNTWCCCEDLTSHTYTGKTIAEAEIACITAIR